MGVFFPFFIVYVRQNGQNCRFRDQFKGVQSENDQGLWVFMDFGNTLGVFRLKR